MNQTSQLLDDFAVGAQDRDRDRQRLLRCARLESECSTGRNVISARDRSLILRRILNELIDLILFGPFVTWFSTPKRKLSSVV